MSASNTTSQVEHVAVQIKPYRRAWFKSAWDGQAKPVGERNINETEDACDECWGQLRYEVFETYCGVCGLVHRRQMFWELSLEIEAQRRQFDHDSGGGTLQTEHVTVVEDSVAETTFDGSKLGFNVYPLDQYNDGRDGHRGRRDDVQKLDREKRFLEHRAEACATAAGLTSDQVREVARLVTSINSGAFASYGPDRYGGGQDAHIVAAIAYVGNKRITDIGDRMESRDEFKLVAAGIGMDHDDVRGAVCQLHKQLGEERD